jgi:hypothetical protein
MARVRGAVDRPQEALTIAEAGLRELPDSPGAHYAAAGDHDAARRPARAGDRPVPDLRREALSDPLLAG